MPLLGYGAVVAGFCALPLAMLNETLAQPLLLLAGKLVSLSNALVMRCAGLPLVHVHGVTRLDVLAFLLFMCLATFVRPPRLRLSLCGVPPICAALIHLAEPSMADGRLHVTMLSVGQAESLLLRLPDGSGMLVDGGGYLYDNGRDFGERILVPALSSLGVRRIDYLVLTHPHPDHLGGLPAVARAFPVGQFWEGPARGTGPLYDRLTAELAARGTHRRRLAAGERIELPGGVRLRVLSPAGRTGRAAEPDTNEDSLVFRLDHGAVSCLFAADAGLAAEGTMLARGVLSPVTLLKVGHHGSRFSSGTPFLDRVAPRVALISAGYGNRFGLPSSRTLAELHRRKVTVYRTDQDGTIELVSDGRGVRIRTPYRPP